MKRTDVEGEVLDAVSTRLMAPEVRAAFVRVFAADWNAEQEDVAWSGGASATG